MTSRRAYLRLALLAIVTPIFAHAQTPGDYLRQDRDQRRDDNGQGRENHRGEPTILTRDQAGPILPPSVFFRGQSAPIQARNSAGLRLGDRLVLAVLVDTSGYSSGVAQTYQAYLITEVPLRIGENTLRPGAYGFGFVGGGGGDQMVVLDLGGNELFRTPTTHEPTLARPTPLQILADPASPNRARLFLGRSFVVLAPA